MPIASSGAISIGNAAGTDRSINVEVGRTQNTANTSMTDVVTAAVTGSTPRGSGTVTQAQPHAFSEWHSYTHTQDFGTPTYYVRNTTSTNVNTQIAAFCVQNSMSIIDGEAAAVSDTIFYMKLNGTVVEFYMDVDHRVFYTGQGGIIDYLSRTAHARDTGGNVASFTGDFTNGFTPMKIAQLETGSVSGREARISSWVIDGVGTHILAGVGGGYTIGDTGSNASTTGWRTPHASTLYGVGPAAWTLVQGFFSNQTRNPFHKITCEVKATGYNIKTLNLFIADHYAYAESNAGY
jgi:hypothetical protein